MSQHSWINTTPWECRHCGLRPDIGRSFSLVCPGPSASAQLLTPMILDEWDAGETYSEWRERVFTPASPACECGARATGVKDYAVGHSSWCPARARS
jgi:hypothetical protein